MWLEGQEGTGWGREHTLEQDLQLERDYGEVENLHGRPHLVVRDERCSEVLLDLVHALAGPASARLFDRSWVKHLTP